VATEGIALDRDHAVGEVVVFAGTDAADQGLGDDRRGDVEIDGFEDGPAAFAGVGYVGFETFEGGILFKGVGGEVEEPGTDDRANLPDPCDLGQVQVEDFLLSRMVKPSA